MTNYISERDYNNEFMSFLRKEEGLKYFIIFSPIVCVVSSLPSIGGLGFREIGWVYLLPLVSRSEVKCHSYLQCQSDCRQITFIAFIIRPFRYSSPYPTPCQSQHSSYH